MNKRLYYLNKSYKYCQKLFYKHSKSYYLGALLFEFNKFKHICAFYGLVRFVDDIVDNEIDILEIKQQKLDKFKKVFFDIFDKNHICYIHNHYQYPILFAIFNTIDEIHIPRHIFERFFKSMSLDLVKYKYETMEELENYMDGSAVIVGEVMLYIMSHDSKFYKNNFKYLLPYSKKLGEAFQITNFIRDIKEDLNMTPSRIYIPNEYLKLYKIDLDKYITNKIDDKFINFIQNQIYKNWNIYFEAQIGINSLKPNHKIAINTSKILYSEILNYIKLNNYELFKDKIKVTFYDKLYIIYYNLGLLNLLKIMINFCLYSIYFYFM